MTAPAKVTVVIPCRNHGEFLGEALDSVAAQTFRDFETIVVDDGSDDTATLEVFRTLPGWVRLVRSPENRGLSAARNLGIREARTPYVSCLDADDRLAPTWLEKGVPVLDGDPSIAFVSHWLETFGDERWDWRPGRVDLAWLLDHNAVNGAALLRREVWEAEGGFDEAMREGCEDWEFWLRLVSHGHRGAILPEVLYFYRRRADSMSREMFRSGAQVDIYSYMVRKHAGAYRQHLGDLVLRREATLSEMSAKGADLEREWNEWLGPLLESRREELARGRARLAGARERKEREDELQRLVAEREEELQRLRKEHGEERQRLEGEIAELRRDLEEESRQADWLELERADLAEKCEWLEEQVAGERRRTAWLEQQRVNEKTRADWFQQEHGALLEQLRWFGQMLDGERVARKWERSELRHQIDWLETEREQLIAWARRAEEAAREIDAIRTAEAARLRSEIEALLASRSWRLTAPLRRLLGGKGTR